MTKNKKTIVEKVKDTVKMVTKTTKEATKKVTGKDMLRDASTGEFFEGKAPKGASPSGTTGGVNFWEVTR